MMQSKEGSDPMQSPEQSLPRRSIPEVSGRRTRYAAYSLLIVLSAGMISGRILAVTAVDVSSIEKMRLRSSVDRQRQQLEARGLRGEALEEELADFRNKKAKQLRLSRPFLSANDRSRWCTIRALVDDGTYAIDQIVTDPAEYPRWQTIDQIKHAQNGEPHLYSSKPTLLPTLLAVEYFVIQKLTGWTLADQPFEVVRTMLLVTNVPAVILILWVIVQLVERLGSTDWGRIAVVATAAGGTFLTTFAVVLNNHLIAATCTSIAFFAVVKIWIDGSREKRWVMLAAFFASLAMAIELPAGLLLAVLGIGCLWVVPRNTLLFGLPVALAVLALAVSTNVLAHRTVFPPYAFRAEGEDWQSGNWYVYDYRVGQRVISSYWKTDADSMQARSKIDRGEPSRQEYIVQSLVGHHGIFSLTPMWILSVAGIMSMLVRRVTPSLRSLGFAIATVSLGCLAFYFSLGEESRNYGGMTSGPRWFFWMIPLWLVALIPAADWSAVNGRRRILTGCLLFFSVLSANYPTWNPWVQPWIYDAMLHFSR